MIKPIATPCRGSAPCQHVRIAHRAILVGRFRHDVINGGIPHYGEWHEAVGSIARPLREVFAGAANPTRDVVVTDVIQRRRGCDDLGCIRTIGPAAGDDKVAEVREAGDECIGVASSVVAGQREVESCAGTGGSKCEGAVDEDRGISTVISVSSGIRSCFCKLVKVV